MKLYIAENYLNCPFWKFLNFHSFLFEMYPPLMFVYITYWHHLNIHSLAEVGFPYLRLFAMKKNRSSRRASLISRFKRSTWGPPGSCRPQMGPMVIPWTFLSGLWHSTVLTVLVRKTTRMTGERVAGHELWQYWYTRGANIYFWLQQWLFMCHNRDYVGFISGRGYLSYIIKLQWPTYRCAFSSLFYVTLLCIEIWK